MKFEVRHSFPCSPEQLWDALLDPDIEARMTAASQSTQELIETRQEDGATYRLDRFTTTNPAIGKLAGLLGTKGLTFDRETWSYPAERRVAWRFLPPAGVSQLVIEGGFTIAPHDEGAERVATGNVEVKVPMVGRTLEGKIVDAIKTMYAKGADVRRRKLLGEL